MDVYDQSQGVAVQPAQPIVLTETDKIKELQPQFAKLVTDLGTSLDEVANLLHDQIVLDLNLKDMEIGIKHTITKVAGFNYHLITDFELVSNNGYRGNILDKLSPIRDTNSQANLVGNITKILSPTQLKPKLTASLLAYQQVKELSSNLSSIRNQFNQITSGTYSFAHDAMTEIRRLVSEIGAQGAENLRRVDEKISGQAEANLKSTDALSQVYLETNKATLVALESIKSAIADLRTSNTDSIDSHLSKYNQVNETITKALDSITQNIEALSGNMRGILDRHRTYEQDSETEIVRMGREIHAFMTTKNTFFTSLIPGGIEQWAYVNQGPHGKPVINKDFPIDDVLELINSAFFRKNDSEHLRSQEMQLRFYEGITTSLYDMFIDEDTNPRKLAGLNNLGFVYMGAYTNIPNVNGITSFDYDAKGIRKMSEQAGKFILTDEILNSTIRDQQFASADFETGLVGISLNPGYGNVEFTSAFATPLGSDIRIGNATVMLHAGWNAAKDLSREILLPASINTGLIVERNTPTGSSFMFVLSNQPMETADGVVKIGNIVKIE